MQIDVLVFPSDNNGSIKGKKVVVIDILRATSTTVTALGNRAAEVIPVVEPVEVTDLVKQLGSRDYVTGGERKGLKIKGFDLGNSPVEYTEERVQGKKVILCTTNGTKAIKWAQGAPEVLIGSFLNIQALVDYLGDNRQEDILIVCSGRENNIALEDLACAGMIIQLLQPKEESILTDTAKLACYVWKQASSGLEKYIKETQHGRYLIDIGMERDIKECLTLNKYPIVARFANSKISL